MSENTHQMNNKSGILSCVVVYDGCRTNNIIRMNSFLPLIAFTFVAYSRLFHKIASTQFINKIKCFFFSFSFGAHLYATKNEFEIWIAVDIVYNLR